MPIRVAGPDGRTYEFPDGTSPAVIESALARQYPKPEGRRSPFKAGWEGAKTQLTVGLPYALEKVTNTLTPQEEADYSRRLQESARKQEEFLPGGATSVQDLFGGKAGLGQFLVENFGVSAPQMGATMAGGLVGGAIGTAVAPGPGTVAGIAAGAAPGALIGGTLAAAPMFVGSNTERAAEGGQDTLTQGEAVRSIAVAPLQALADSAANLLMPGVSGLILRRAALPAAKGIVGATVRGVGKGALAETITEPVQQVGERFAAGLPLGDREAFGEYGTAAATAGIMGGVMGGVGGSAEYAFRDRPTAAPTADGTARAQGEFTPEERQVFDAAIADYMQGGMSLQAATKAAVTDVTEFGRTANAAGTDTGGLGAGVPSPDGEPVGDRPAGEPVDAGRGDVGAAGGVDGAPVQRAELVEPPLKNPLPVHRRAVVAAFESTALDYEEDYGLKFAPEDLTEAATILANDPTVTPEDAVRTVIEKRVEAKALELPETIKGPDKIADVPVTPELVVAASQVMSQQLVTDLPQLQETYNITDMSPDKVPEIVAKAVVAQMKNTSLTPSEALVKALPKPKKQVAPVEVAKVTPPTPAPVAEIKTPELASESAPGVAEWDRANRARRSDELFGGYADTIATFNADPRALTIPAHGMSKQGTVSEAYANLKSMLRNGLDPTRRGGRLDTAPLNAVAGESASAGTTAGGHAYRDGPFVILQRPGASGITSREDIGGVLVNDALAETGVVEQLRAENPDLAVHLYSEVGAMLDELVGGRTAEPATTSFAEKPKAYAERTYSDKKTQAAFLKGVDAALDPKKVLADDALAMLGPRKAAYEQGKEFVQRAQDEELVVPTKRGRGRPTLEAQAKILAERQLAEPDDTVSEEYTGELSPVQKEQQQVTALLNDLKNSGQLNPQEFTQLRDLSAQGMRRGQLTPLIKRAVLKSTGNPLGEDYFTQAFPMSLDRSGLDVERKSKLSDEEQAVVDVLNAKENAAVRAELAKTYQGSRSTYSDDTQFDVLDAYRSLSEGRGKDVRSPRVKEILRELFPETLAAPKQYEVTRRGLLAGIASGAVAVATQAEAYTLPRTSVDSMAGVKAALKTGDLGQVVRALQAQLTDPNMKEVARLMLLGGFGDVRVNVVDYGNAELDVLGETDSATGNVTLYKTTNGPSGDTAETILHEAMHSWLVRRIRSLNMYNARNARLAGFDKTQNIDPFVKEFQDLWRSFSTAMKTEYPALVENEIWASEAYRSPDELFVRAFSDPDLQAFLKRIDINGDTLKSPATKSFWDKIVDAFSKLFGITRAPVKSALETIMNAGYGVLKAGALDTPTGEFTEKVTKFDNANERVQYAKTKRQSKIENTQAGLELSHRVMDVVRNTSDLVPLTRNPKRAVSVLQSLGDALKPAALRALLPTMSSNDIIRWVSNRLPGLSRVRDAVDDMGRFRTQLITDLAKKVPEWVAYNKKVKGTKEEYALADAMHFATLHSVDPSVGALRGALANDETLTKLGGAIDPKANSQRKTRTAEITEAYNYWNALSPEGQAIFRMAKKAYQDTFDLHMKLLLEKIETSGLDDDKKKRTVSYITQQFQDAKKLGLYFPLMRYGQYWARFGTRGKTEFYMFESAVERNEFVKDRVQELQKAGDTRSLNTMIEEGYLDRGDTLDVVKNEFTKGEQASDVLKSIYGVLDSGVVDGAELKDLVYQMYLRTLPDADLRKKFMHRKGTKGYGSDVLRNFISSQYSEANRLARLKYGEQIRLRVGESYASLQGNPDKINLAPFVDEISRRAFTEVMPVQPQEGGIDWDNLATIGNKAVFFWFLTSPKSALIQFTQLPMVGLPVLTAKYGAGKTMATAARYLNLFNKLGVPEQARNGVTLKFEGLNISDSAYIKNMKNTVRKDALLYADKFARERELYLSTYAADMSERSSAPSAAYESLPSQVTRNTLDTISGLFHHMERINRQIMYMSSFELAYDARMKETGATSQSAAELAAQDAFDLTEEAMFDYSAFNKPSVFKSPVGRITFQFMTYPIQMTSFIVRNAYNMFKATKPGERKEAAIKFFGTMGMSAMFSGATGILGYHLMIGLLEGLRDILRPDEDDEDADEYYDDAEDNPLGKRSLDLWFRSWFLPNYFGAGSAVAEALNLSPEQAGLLQRSIEFGPVSALTDLNVSGSTSLDGLWFHDDTPAESNEEATKNAMLGLFGPLGSLVIQGGQAVDAFGRGDGIRGVEKLLPAFFRGSATAVRLGSEGLTTRDGAELVAAEEYTFGKLLAQTAGFASTNAGEIQKRNLLAKRMVLDIEKSRTKLLDKLDKAYRRYDANPTDANDAGIESVLEDIDTFNYENNVYPITADTISRSLTGQERRRGEAIQGLTVGKPFRSSLEGLFEEELDIENADEEE